MAKTVNYDRTNKKLWRNEMPKLFSITEIGAYNHKVLPASFQYPTPDSHDFIELFYVARGDRTLFLDGKEIVLKAGQCLFTAPFTNHRTDASPSGLSTNVMLMNFTCISDCDAFFHDRIFDLSSEEKRLVNLIFAELDMHFERIDDSNPTYFGYRPKSDTPAYTLQLIASNLEQLLLQIYKRHHNNTPVHTATTVHRDTYPNETINSIIDYFHEHIEEKLTLESIAQAFYISPSYLRRIFRQATSKSVMEYFRKLKMDYAESLLRDGQLTVSEIAEKLNFSSSQAFSRAFRHDTGKTPTDYAYFLASGIKNVEDRIKKLHRR